MDGCETKMQFGMPTLIENKTLLDNINLCSRLNLDFIELNMNFPEYQLEQLERTDFLLEEGERKKIYFTIHLDENLNIADFNNLVSDAYLETVRRTIDVAKKLVPLCKKYGNKNQPLTLNMHMNHGIYITLPDRKVRMYEHDFETYINSFRRFKTKCEEWIGGADIKIVVENVVIETLKIVVENFVYVLLRFLLAVLCFWPQALKKGVEVLIVVVLLIQLIVDLQQEEKKEEDKNILFINS